MTAIFQLLFYPILCQFLCRHNLFRAQPRSNPVTIDGGRFMAVCTRKVVPHVRKQIISGSYTLIYRTHRQDSYIGDESSQCSEYYRANNTNMDRKITAKGLSAGSLYKILFIGHAFSMGLLIVCMGVFSLFGFETVHIEGVPAVGLKGLLTAIVVAAVFSLVFSFVASAFYDASFSSYHVF